MLLIIFDIKVENICANYIHVTISLNFSNFIMHATPTKITERITCILQQTVGGYENGYMFRILITLKKPP